MAAGASQSHPHQLRIAGFDDDGARTEWNTREQARLAIIKENRIAAHGAAAAMDPRDPRWRLAMQTQAQLQGPTLSPERRDRLMRNARSLGIRPFEANLVIAIVQDRARRGESASNAAPALRLISEPPDGAVMADSAPPPNRVAVLTAALHWVAALGASATVAMVLARWVLNS